MTYREFLQFVGEHFKYRVLHAFDGSLYLTRYAILDESDEGNRVWLHHFHSGDEDREPHNHPFKYGVSLILSGSYMEERLRIPFKPGWAHMRWTRYRAGDLNFVDSTTYHRVHLESGEEAWSLFVTGPIVAPWGFLNLDTGVWLLWTEFLKSKGRNVSDGSRDSRYKPALRTVRTTVSDAIDRARNKLADKLRWWARGMGEYPIHRGAP